MINRDEHLRDSNGLFDCTSSGWEFYLGKGGFIRATLQNRWRGGTDGVVVKTRHWELWALLYSCHKDVIRDLSNTLSYNYQDAGIRRLGETFQSHGAIWTLVKHGHTVQ